MDGLTPGGRRTYWHLESLGRKPGDYDIGTSNLLWYIGRGFEVHGPVEQWHARHNTNGAIAELDWDRFRDPRETTYTRYLDVQAAKETFVDGLLRSIDGTAYDRELPAPWVRFLDRVLAPMRFPIHGQHMVAAYVGQMAPSGRLVVAGLFQAADEMRRVQHLAYRTRQLQLAHDGFASHSRGVWETDPLWQPLRQVVERLLVTFDWGEALVALNLVVKPLMDELFTTQLGRAALRQGDSVLDKILFSLHEDCVWHRAWTGSLVEFLLVERPRSRALLGEWIGRWTPPCATAVAAFAPAFDEAAGAALDVRAAIDAPCRDWWRSLGLEVPR
jgi:toluene monooxygenase system protein E